MVSADPSILINTCEIFIQFLILPLPRRPLPRRPCPPPPPLSPPPIVTAPVAARHPAPPSSASPRRAAPPLPRPRRLNATAAPHRPDAIPAPRATASASGRPRPLPVPVVTVAPGKHHADSRDPFIPEAVRPPPHRFRPATSTSPRTVSPCLLPFPSHCRPRMPSVSARHRQPSSPSPTTGLFFIFLLRCMYVCMFTV